VTRYNEYECYGTTLHTETYDDTARYVITGGKLYIWSDGRCLADVVLSGSSSTITGKWTATSLTFTDSVPAAYRSAECTDDYYDYYDYYSDNYGDEESLPDIFENLKATYTITGDNIHGRLSGELCLAPVMAGTFAGEDSSGITVVSSSCSSVTLRNGMENTTATVTSTLQDGAIVTTFSSGDSVCALPGSFDLSDEPPVCSESDGDGLEYFGCLVGSGFFGDFTFEKKASIPTERRFKSALKRRLPFAR
jgi:hypothetical protein